MKKAGFFVIAVFFLLLSISGYADDTIVSTDSDITEREVTIYNNNIGLVNDTRNIRLKSGIITIQFVDVPSALVAESVSLRIRGDVTAFTVLEQNYGFDILTPQKLIDEYIGKKVRLEYINPKTGIPESVTATILSNTGGTVYQIGEEVTFNHPGRIIFPGLPTGLSAVPTISWLVDSKAGGQQTIHVDYLIRDISWKATYSLVLDEGDKSADLIGWITVDNRSGTDFKDVKMRFVAGEINLEDRISQRRLMIERAVSPADQFKEKQFFEYHLYDIQRETSINNDQKKQIQLLNVDQVPVKKRFILRGDTEYYYVQYRKGVIRKGVDIYFEIENDKKNNLGIPLPNGMVRVYKRDDSGMVLFIGEDGIDHTPENETVKIMTGRAFDIISERKQTDWVRIAEGVFESTLEVRIRNHKKEDVEVTVIEPVPGDWRVLETSHDYRKTSANEAEFGMTVPSGKEAVLNYRVRVIL